MKNVEKKFTVYKHTNKINGKIYIGITSKKPEIRWNNGIGYKNNKYFWNSIKKYGWNNFKHEIISNNLNKKDACDKEIELIEFYNSTDKKFGYNVSKGGSLNRLGCKHSEKTRKKMSKNHADFKGDKSTSSIKIICLETLEIFNSTHEAGRKLNIDCRGIHNVLRNKTKSCNNLHFVYLKDYDSNKKYDLSIGDTKPKKVICIETGQIFNSIADASRYFKVPRSNLSGVLHGRYKTTGNLHFKYYINGEVKNEIKN